MAIYETSNEPVKTLVVERAAGALAQSGDLSLFTVSGTVIIKHILGKVTTIIQNQANATLLKVNPTVGADVDLCAALDIDNDAVGTMYSVTGDFSDAMVEVTSGAIEGEASLQSFIVTDGVIEMECAASNTGAIQWTIVYQPLTKGANIVAA